MGTVSLDDIVVTPLRRIPTPGGDVLHAIRQDDPGFRSFGEAYFSCVDSGAVKAWKRHRRMTLNLIVPVGEVRFVFHVADNPGIAEFRVETIGSCRYARLTVPPGIYFGFQGVAPTQSLILNVADYPHDPEEVERRPSSDVAFDW